MRLTMLALAIACSINTAIADENDAIARTVFDYINGWYDGDAVQMERALHPDLAKRTLHTDDKGRTHVEHMGAMRLVQLARAGVGTTTPADKRIKEVVILDVHDDIASVKAITSSFVDFLHLARIDDRWVIVNVLWVRNHSG